MSSEMRTGRSNIMPVELMSAIDEANATSPLEWFAATSIYITHVVNDIEWNKSNLRM